VRSAIQSASIDTLIVFGDDGGAGGCSFSVSADGTFHSPLRPASTCCEEAVVLAVTSSQHTLEYLWEWLYRPNRRFRPTGLIKSCPSLIRYDTTAGTAASSQHVDAGLGGGRPAESQRGPRNILFSGPLHIPSHFPSLPSPPFPFSPPFPPSPLPSSFPLAPLSSFSFPPLFSPRSRPLKSSYGVWGSAVRSPSRN